MPVGAEGKTPGTRPPLASGISASQVVKERLAKLTNC
jgi:hypothetical protein